MNKFYIIEEWATYKQPPNRYTLSSRDGDAARLRYSNNILRYRRPRRDVETRHARNRCAGHARCIHAHGQRHGKHIRKQAPVRAVAGYAANGQCSEL